MLRSSRSHNISGNTQPCQQPLVAYHGFVSDSSLRKGSFQPAPNNGQDHALSCVLPLLKATYELHRRCEMAWRHGRRSASRRPGRGRTLLHWPHLCGSGSGRRRNRSFADVLRSPDDVNLARLVVSGDAEEDRASEPDPGFKQLGKMADTAGPAHETKLDVLEHVELQTGIVFGDEKVGGKVSRLHHQNRGSAAVAVACRLARAGRERFRDDHGSRRCCQRCCCRLPMGSVRSAS